MSTELKPYPKGFMGGGNPEELANKVDKLYLNTSNTNCSDEEVLNLLFSIINTKTIGQWINENLRSNTISLSHVHFITLMKDFVSTGNLPYDFEQFVNSIEKGNGVNPDSFGNDNTTTKTVEEFFHIFLSNMSVIRDDNVMIQLLVLLKCMFGNNVEE